MLDKPLAGLTKSDLERLVADRVSEGRTRDYKRDLELASDAHKKEVARDVSSLANAAGGYLVYGVEEERDADGKNTGTPARILGVSCPNFDQTKLRYESIVSDYIDPRVQGIDIRAIDGFERGPAIVVHVPRSWFSPHMLSYQKQTHFYSRNTSGRRDLDVREIRAAFLAGSEVTARLTRFRQERIGRILADDTPVTLRSGRDARAIVHVLPVTGPDGFALDIADLGAHPERMPPPVQNSWDHRFNLDGVVSYSPSDGSRAYTQAFRDGSFEGVALVSLFLEGQSLMISALLAETVLSKAVEGYAGLLRAASFDGPLSVAVALLGVRGVGIRAPEEYWDRGGQSFDRDVVVLPDVLLEGAKPDVRQTMRPAFDALWQAGGWPRSLGYTETGECDPRRHT